MAPVCFPHQIQTPNYINQLSATSINIHVNISLQFELMNTHTHLCFYMYSCLFYIILSSLRNRRLLSSQPVLLTCLLRSVCVHSVFSARNAQPHHSIFKLISPLPSSHLTPFLKPSLITHLQITSHAC